MMARGRCYKEGVDGAFSQENERADLMLSLMQSEDGHREAFEQDVHEQLSPTVTGEVISRQEMFDGASCERGHVNVDEEAECDDRELQQLVPRLANQGEQVVVLDDEEMDIDDTGAGAVLLTDQVVLKTGIRPAILI